MWIKICGITTPEDAVMVAEAGADAIGLNFFEKSKRFVAPDAAREIRDTVPEKVDVVGVFVNSPAQHVAQVVDAVGLTTVQFHGDESVEDIVQLHRLTPGVKIIRAFRVGVSGTGEVTASLDKLSDVGVPLTAVLTDAHVVGEYGGTGKMIDPSLLQQRPQRWPNLILAGGLTPETVGAAIEKVQPWGVDTASGVESAPGVKSPERVLRFINMAQRGDV